MSDVDCTVIYSEASNIVSLRADSSLTVAAVKKQAVIEMEKHMAEVVPGLELEPNYTDFFPASVNEEERLATLPLAEATILVWPKQTADGKNQSPLRDQREKNKQQLRETTAQLNAMRLIAQDEGSDVTRPKKPNRGKKIDSKNVKLAKSENSDAELAAKVEALTADNAQMRVDNAQMRTDNAQMRTDNAEFQRNFMERLKAIERTMRDLALRKLLDMGRDTFAQKCRYQRWEDMKDTLGVDPAKEMMINALDDDQTKKWECKTGSLVNLVVDPNELRARGNSSAHDHDVQEIQNAVESLPEGKTRKMLIELSEYLF